MTPWFADTFFYLALLNATDEAHRHALDARDSGHLTVTTEFVMIELADNLCNRQTRHLFLTLDKILRGNASVEIVPLSDKLLSAGKALYARRGDKDWSLTDCTSFIVMSERGIVDALTADHHFEQAGFRALLK
jgi:predicted nucleic acid-binding protein